MSEDSSVVAPADVAPEDSETAPVLPASPSNGKAQDGIAASDAVPKPSAGMSCCKKLMCTSLCMVVSFVAFIGIGLQVGFVTIEDSDEAPASSASRAAEFSTAATGSSISGGDLPPELAYLQGQIPAHAEHTREMQVLVKTKDTFPEASEAPTPTARPTASAKTSTSSNGTNASVAVRSSSTNTSNQSNLTATNASANASNESNVTTTAEKAQEHKHLSCKGGPTAVCQCLLSCEVFGNQPGACTDSSKAHLLDTLVQKALNSTETACVGMQCIARCSKRLGCYGEEVEKDCRALEERTQLLRKQAASSDAEMRSKAADTCEFECDADDGIFGQQKESTDALEE